MQVCFYTSAPRHPDLCCRSELQRRDKHARKQSNGPWLLLRFRVNRSFTAVGSEPTLLWAGALGQRLRPLRPSCHADILSPLTYFNNGSVIAGCALRSLQRTMMGTIHATVRLPTWAQPRAETQKDQEQQQEKHGEDRRRWRAGRNEARRRRGRRERMRAKT